MRKRPLASKDGRRGWGGAGGLRGQPAGGGRAVSSGRTLVAVGSAESRVAGAGEVAVRLADATPPGAAHVRRDVTHSLCRLVCRHGDRATVNYCKGGGG